MAEGSEQVRSSATDLSKLAEALQTTVSKFQLR
jgi:methyl-accepting chemotaxis protein